jgi:hypothetical protein
MWADLFHAVVLSFGTSSRGCNCPSASRGFSDEIHYATIIIGMVTLDIDGYVTRSRATP